MSYKIILLIYLQLLNFSFCKSNNENYHGISDKVTSEESVLSKNNRAFINSWVKFDKNGKLLPNNWGDDLNFHFLNKIFDVDFEYYDNKKNIASENYSLIGSILYNDFIFNNTIIWGSGTQDETIILENKPKKVLAVRGPLTRKYLINQGIDCPEIYGDPSVLLPHFYKPKIEKKYEIGLIPHLVSLNSKTVNRLQKKKGIHLIKLKEYKHWLDVIDEILSCKYIVSESLHGLIISETYGIPNLWVKIRLNKYNIKFHDWFLSIGVDREKPYQIRSNTKIKNLMTEIKKYKKGNPIDVDKLMSVCPFKLKNINNIKIIKYKNFTTKIK